MLVRATDARFLLYFTSGSSKDLKLGTGIRVIGKGMKRNCKEIKGE